MTAQDLILIAGACSGLLISIGGGGRWLLGHIDSRTMASEAREAEARKELRERLEGEIAELRHLVERLQGREGLYVLRVGHLEHAIYKQPGMLLPDTIGWPPQ